MVSFCILAKKSFQLMPSILRASDTNTIAIRYHFLFWIFYFCFNVFRWGSYFNDYMYSFKSNLVEYPLHIGLFYLHTQILIPKFILQKKIKTYLLWLILVLILIYNIRTGLNFLFVTDEIWPESETYGMFFNPNHFIAVVLGELYALTFVLSIKLVIDLNREREQKRAIESLQAETELQFLKAQIQPHFFFNTLNNLYALILNQSPKASEILIKLSELMRYVIYEAEGKSVLLAQELVHIKNFIALKELSFDNRLKFELYVDPNLKNEIIPPLLFSSLLENCFKHGVMKNHNLWIKLILKKKDNSYFKLTLKNSISDNQQKKSLGIGLRNSRRRLKLIYGDDFQLKINRKKDQFNLHLILPNEYPQLPIIG